MLALKDGPHYAIWYRWGVPQKYPAIARINGQLSAVNAYMQNIGFSLANISDLKLTSTRKVSTVLNWQWGNLQEMQFCKHAVQVGKLVNIILYTVHFQSNAFPCCICSQCQLVPAFKKWSTRMLDIYRRVVKIFPMIALYKVSEHTWFLLQLHRTILSHYSGTPLL